MNDHEFLRSSLPSEVIAAPQQRLFDSNLPVLQSAVDAWDRYRMPESRQVTTQSSQTDGALTHIRYEQAIAPGAVQTVAPGVDQSVQSDMRERYDYVRASMNGESEKKDGTSHLLVVGIELAAVALLVRLGLKHFAKNGARAVGEAENLTSGVGAKLNGAAPKSFTSSPIIDVPPNSAGIINTHPLPRIRTKERETGVFNYR